jgi:glycosyltransferase involved in cell wall biosynthesis
MKILITTFTFPPEENGVSLVTYAHALCFAKRGYHVSVATNFNEKRNVEEFRKRGINIYQFKIKGSANIREGYRGQIDDYKTYLINQDADIILFHCWQSWPTDIGLQVSQFINSKKILVSHGISANLILKLRNILSWFLWRPYVCRLKYMIKKFDHIVFLWDTIDKNRFYDYYIVKKYKYSNFSIIPNGTFPLNNHLDFRKKYNIKENLLLLSVGAYNYLKNQKLILEAFAECNINDAHLVLIGNEKNNYYEKLIYLAKKYGIEEKVSVLSGLIKEEIESAYMSADIFLHSSLSEVQPPFISTNVGCIRDLPGGMIARNKPEMILKIKYLAENKDIREKLGLEGKKAANKKFNWEKIAEEYEELFFKLLKKFNK